MIGELLSVDEVATLIKCSGWTVRHWEREGKLRAVRAGKLVRFERVEVERFLSQSSSARLRESATGASV